MDGFDTTTMTYMAAPTNMQYDHAPDAYSKMLIPPMDAFDHQSNYDANTFAGSEDMYALPQQVTPSMKRFSTNFEDPFSDVVSAFEQPLANQESQGLGHEGEKTVDRDHKLLSFSLPNYDYVLLDYTFRQTSISLSAQLHGMFFLAESPWAGNADGTGPPAELTCYRRNLFQITGNITLPRALRYIMTNEGKQIPILSQKLVVSATESTEGNPVKVISVPWKTPANANPPSSEDKAEREPPSIPLDMSTIQDLDSEYASFPFQWKRLQFRIATANNGRRKELQQHFLLHLKLVATLATGGKITIATAQSGAVIVRGRSPRNFQSRKDTPLTGAGNHVRKASAMPGHLNRLQSVDSGTTSGTTRQQVKTTEPTSAPIKTEAPAPAMSVASFYEAGEFSMPAVPTGLFENTMLPDPHQQAQQGAHAHAHQGAMTAMPADAVNFDSLAPNQARGYPMSSPDLSRPTQRPAAAARAQQPQPPVLKSSAPTKLSLVDDDSPKAVSVSPKSKRRTPPASYNHYSNAGANPSKRQATMPPPQATSHSRGSSAYPMHVVSSPDESADLLYEYFPLGLDDWMPPVDAVYRPHVVHHILPIVAGPEGMKTGNAVGVKGGLATAAGGIGGWGSRSKRYFSEDVG